METTRKELFDLVWEYPMTHLAKRFGYSDVGLRNICVSNKIPLPEIGHWAKKQFNKAASKPLLHHPNFNPKIRIAPRNIDAQSKAISRLKMNRGNEKILEPAESLENPHPLVASTLKLYSTYEKLLAKKSSHTLDEYRSYDSNKLAMHRDKGRYHFHPSDGVIPITATMENVPRILKLLDPILKKLNQEGFKLRTTKEPRLYERRFLIEKDGDSITISIRQGYSWKLATPEEKKTLDIYGDKYAVANENITFDVIGLNPTLATSFRHGKAKKLEDQLDQIFQTILNMPQMLKEKRKQDALREAERERVSKIHSHNYAIAESQRMQFDVALKEVEVFNKLNQLRSYLNLLESSISGLAETQRKHAEFWIKIVTLRIEEMDPLEKRVKYFESFDPEKQSYYDGSWHKTPMRL
jgi:hypothetical protein